MTILHIPEYTVEFSDSNVINDKVKNLYLKFEEQNWKTSDLCWDADYDRTNPMNIDDRSLPIFNSSLWQSFSEEEKTQYRLHSQAAMLSNMVFSEHHGAMALGKIITMLPDYTSRLFMSTQLLDEFRHAEILQKAFSSRFNISYSIKPKAISLIENSLISDSWDRAYLVILMFEVFANLHYLKLSKTSNDPLFLQIFQKIHHDEARHMAYTKFLMNDYFSNLSQDEITDREDVILGLVDNIEEYFSHYQLVERLGYDREQFEAAYTEHNTGIKKVILVQLSTFLESLNLYTPRLKSSFEKISVS